ncbi:MAG: hydroxyacid dehydrogenase [Planctomycetes bacterium]|nr:hydroxyacid dehydrogenase [Planctomycetota bacterium]MCC7171419.1 hydroxyacid dehydrogenase [Planctomycetota bacterium]
MSILLLESLHDEAEQCLARCGTLVRAASPTEVVGDLADVRAILTRGRGRIDAALMARCPQLRVVARPGAGVDNIDVDAAKARGVAVVHAPGMNAATVAEHAIALILDVVRGVTRWAGAVRAGRWNDRGGYAGNELGGLTLGVVGFGNIGRRVAELACAFRMRVVVARHGEKAAEPGIESMPLAELLRCADVVTLHTPLTAATRGMIGAGELACMKPTAFLVNTARGALIDQAALKEALRQRRIAGFAADVLAEQPPAQDDDLLRMEGVVITPHVASLTAGTYRAMCVETARRVVEALATDR